MRPQEFGERGRRRGHARAQHPHEPARRVVEVEDGGVNGGPHGDRAGPVHEDFAVRQTNPRQGLEVHRWPARVALASVDEDYSVGGDGLGGQRIQGGVHTVIAVAGDHEGSNPRPPGVGEERVVLDRVNVIGGEGGCGRAAQTARFLSLRRSRSERPPQMPSARRWPAHTPDTRIGPRTRCRPSWPRGWSLPSRGRRPPVSLA